MDLIRSISLFVTAGIFEIAGGWMIWQSVREGRPLWWALVGAIVLVAYGIVPTLQPAHFGRVYAAYGGFFIALSLPWGWRFDGNVPDRADVVGATIALLGVGVMMYWPRSFMMEHRAASGVIGSRDSRVS